MPHRKPKKVKVLWAVVAICALVTMVFSSFLVGFGV
jgi:hypothetical protein